MEKELLKVINDELVKILNYEYGEYTGDLKYPYSVGEHYERGYIFEENKTLGEFILTVFHKGKEIDLIDIKEQIKEKFADYRTVTESGTINISYRDKLFIRSGEADLKKMEIYLDTNYWKGVKV